jgi:hypothetical protein
MKAHLLKWHPEWKKETINKWSDKQIMAIYMKELKKPHINTKEKIKQLSFF